MTTAEPNVTDLSVSGTKGARRRDVSVLRHGDDQIWNGESVAIERRMGNLCPLDEREAPVRKTPKLLLVAGLCWSALIILLTLMVTLDRLRRGEDPEFAASLKDYATGFAPWLLLLPAIYLVSLRDTLQRRRVKARVARGAALMAFCLAAAGAYLFFVQAPLLGLDGWGYLRSVPVIGWIIDFFIFGLSYIAGQSQGEKILKERETEQRRQLGERLLKLESDAAQMEARELRYRFSSHFMLNALSNILGLMRSGDARAAEDALLALGEILKRISRGPGRPLSQIRAELDFVRVYLQFQKMRYPDVAYEERVADEVKSFLAPDFILQPLIENAFKHGMSAGGRLEIALDGRIEGAHVVLTLRNSAGAPQKPRSQEGEGLKLTRARLRLAFNEDFMLDAGPQGGRYIAELRFPRVMQQ